MIGKLTIGFYASLVVLLAATVYYFTAINPPRWLGLVVAIIIGTKLLIALALYAYVKIKELFNQFVRKEVKKILSEGDFEVWESHYKGDRTIGVKFIEKEGSC